MVSIIRTCILSVVSVCVRYLLMISQCDYILFVCYNGYLIVQGRCLYFYIGLLEGLDIRECITYIEELINKQVLF